MQFSGSRGIVLSTRLYYFVKTKPTEYHEVKGRRQPSSSWKRWRTGGNRDFVVVNKREETGGGICLSATSSVSS